MSGSEIRQALRDFELRELFNGLGWDNSSDQQYITVADGEGTDTWYELNAVAQKRGMMVFTVVARPGESLPDAATRKKIERELTKLYAEHFVVYASADKGEQVWQWVKRQSGSPAMVREQRFTGGNPTENLVQRIRGISFSIEEEDELGELDVFGRVQASFDVEKVTKGFYESFKKEHDAFLSFIQGLDDLEEKRWYASIMLNRLMFVYFVQRKGFLDGNQNYMRDKMRQMKAEEVEGNFLTFYKRFLLKLFLQGLGQAQSSREPEVDGLIGDIPYLNGGLFDAHGIEESNPGLDIPDEAFERVFDFFDRYDWHLDERPLRNSNEINPDVLGYIFEKYINQRQMGAYYTKEDVTGYISQNTVIPYLFDATEEECHIAFRPDSSMWGLLADNPDLYIYDAVLKGVDEPLPQDIAAGIDDVSERGRWNRAADDGYALPTETWREHVARRERCEELRSRLSTGEIKSINELVTLNLNIRQFAEDAVIHCEGADFLRAFYKAVREVSVLDPACGSGAFLFAALNVLEPLYDACLERMRQFVDEDPTGERYQDFRDNLAEVAEHTSRRYFILKSIAVRNLYGVDIMEEAVEIARLRLFLKLMAQIDDRDEIEPLPDLDFNLRAGNTLVGFASVGEVRRTLEKKLDFGGSAEKIEEGAAAADDAFGRFRRMQMEGPEGSAGAKADLLERLSGLNAELDQYLAHEYGVQPGKEEEFAAWRESHRPFHWLVEFFGILNGGGFSVVIGNPPYVSAKKIPYSKSTPYQDTFPDIYADVMLRAIDLGADSGRGGMIVPLSITFADDFRGLRKRVRSTGSAWLCSFDNIPASIFEGVSQRCTIWIGALDKSPRLEMAPMYRWRSSHRPALMKSISFVSSSEERGIDEIPKLGGASQIAALNLVRRAGGRPPVRYNPGARGGRYSIGYSQAARNFVSAFIQDPPVLDASSLDPLAASKVGRIRLETEEVAHASLASLVGEFYLWYWLVRGDGFDVTKWIVSDFLVSLNAVSDDHFGLLARLGDILHARRYDALAFKKNAGKYVGNYNFGSLREVTRRADLVLMDGLGIDPRTAVDVLDYVQRVLSINVMAGEKSIPNSVKRNYFTEDRDTAADSEVFSGCDAFLAERYGFTDEELDFIINHDIKYRMGVEEG